MPSATSQLRPVRWQGLGLDLPAGWDPVKLEGDASQGLMLLADLTRPKLGVRWKTLKKKADVAKTVAVEVGRRLGYGLAGTLGSRRACRYRSKINVLYRTLCLRVGDNFISAALLDPQMAGSIPGE